MEGCQSGRYHYDRGAYDVVSHNSSPYALSKSEAMSISVAAIASSFWLFAVGKMDDTRDHNKHSEPHESAQKESMNPLEVHHPVSFVVESQQPGDEDDHIENKRHIHVDVDHATDHFAPPPAQAPAISCIIVNSKGHREEEDEVGKDEVEYSDGGGGS